VLQKVEGKEILIPEQNEEKEEEGLINFLNFNVLYKKFFNSFNL